MNRPYTGWDKNSDGKRAGSEALSDCLEAYFGLWNNGTWGVRNMRGKGKPSVHGTARAGDNSWRGAPYRGSGKYESAQKACDFLVEHADELGLEFLCDYYAQPYGRGWMCTRADDANGGWMAYSTKTVSGAPGGDWLHWEISNDTADDPERIIKVFKDHLGEPEKPVQAAPSRKTTSTPAKKSPWLQRGSRGGKVREVQEILGITVDGDFGPKTEAAVKAWQADNDLHVDGIVGPATYEAMKTGNDKPAESAPAPAPAATKERPYPGRPVRKGSRGDDVKWVQQIIGATADGVFGNVTHRTLQQWQRRRRLASDGVAGPKTWRALNNAD